MPIEYKIFGNVQLRDINKKVHPVFYADMILHIGKKTYDATTDINGNYSFRVINYDKKIKENDKFYIEIKTRSKYIKLRKKGRDTEKAIYSVDFEKVKFGSNSSIKLNYVIDQNTDQRGSGFYIFNIVNAAGKYIEEECGVSLTQIKGNFPSDCDLTYSSYNWIHVSEEYYADTTAIHEFGHTVQYEIGLKYLKENFLGKWKHQWGVDLTGRGSKQNGLFLAMLESFCNVLQVVVSNAYNKPNKPLFEYPCKLNAETNFELMQADKNGKLYYYNYLSKAMSYGEGYENACVCLLLCLLYEIKDNPHFNYELVFYEDYQDMTIKFKDLIEIYKEMREDCSFISFNRIFENRYKNNPNLLGKYHYLLSHCGFAPEIKLIRPYGDTSKLYFNVGGSRETEVWSAVFPKTKLKFTGRTYQNKIKIEVYDSRMVKKYSKIYETDKLPNEDLYKTITIDRLSYEEAKGEFFYCILWGCSDYEKPVSGWYEGGKIKVMSKPKENNNDEHHEENNNDGISSNIHDHFGGPIKPVKGHNDIGIEQGIEVRPEFLAHENKDDKKIDTGKVIDGLKVWPEPIDPIGPIATKTKGLKTAGKAVDKASAVKKVKKK